MKRVLLSVPWLLAAASTGRSASARPPSPRALAPWHAFIARVRVEARRDRVRVTTDVVVWTSRRVAPPLDLYAAYGAPGPPLATDAELLAVPRGYLDAPRAATAEPLALSFSPTAPRASDVVLGSPRMAGSKLVLGASALRAALAPSGAACLRLSSVRAMPAPGPDGSREIIVRLGARASAPLALGEVEVVGKALRRREAELCEGGPVADRPLAITPVLRNAAPGAPPALARRTPSDALCVRLWLSPQAQP